jgi:hypothetical protein
MAKTEESALRDTELYSRVLGIELPWFVSDVSVQDARWGSGSPNGLSRLWGEDGLSSVGT